MTKKLIAITVLVSILTLTIPKHTFGIVIPPDIGTGSQIPATGGLVCTGPFTKIICVVKKVSDVIRTIQKITKSLDYLPHSFPFGGPILSSEQACSFHFDEYTFISGTLTYCSIIGCFQFGAGPVPISIPLTNRAIEVGPPVPSGGKIISFPWISKIYENHTENRAGPWALGLGFSPFPLGDINNALGSIKIRIPPNQLSIIDAPCWAPIWPNGGTYTGVCIDDIRFDCKVSGEKDPQGNDIYKVIRLLGTSRENAPASAFPSGFTLPLP